MQHALNVALEQKYPFLLLQCPSRLESAIMPHRKTTAIFHRAFFLLYKDLFSPELMQHCRSPPASAGAAEVLGKRRIFRMTSKGGYPANWKGGGGEGEPLFFASGISFSLFWSISFAFHFFFFRRQFFGNQPGIDGFRRRGRRTFLPPLDPPSSPTFPKGGKKFLWGNSIFHLRRLPTAPPPFCVRGEESWDVCLFLLLQKVGEIGSFIPVAGCSQNRF